MPEYPVYPGTGPEQPDDRGTPAPPPPPPGAWPPPAPQQPQHQPGFQAPPGVRPPPGVYPVDGSAPAAYGYVAPRHPNATTSMVLGIVGLAGAFICFGVPIVLTPFAWFMGAKAVREIDASGGQLSGRSEAAAGKVLGIIGTVLLVLGLALVALLVVLAIASPGVYEEQS